MKTIKEQYASVFQHLGKVSMQRRFYEAISAPWWILDDVKLIDVMKDFSWQGPEDFIVRLPHHKMVIALSDMNGLALYVETDGSGVFQGSWTWIKMEKGKPSIWSLRMGLAEEFIPPDIDVADLRVTAVLLAMTRLLADGRVHVAKVSPVNKMKSVVWTKAQEHYVFLSSGHPANNSAAGPQQQYDEAEAVKRMAHRVRAHMRVLRSPRFRFKQGQRIWIQEQWRGPKEWINKRSRQIYRWVDKQTFNISPDGRA